MSVFLPMSYDTSNVLLNFSYIWWRDLKLKNVRFLHASLKGRCRSLILLTSNIFLEEKICFAFRRLRRIVLVLANTRLIFEVERRGQARTWRLFHSTSCRFSGMAEKVPSSQVMWCQFRYCWAPYGEQSGVKHSLLSFPLRY